MDLGVRAETAGLRTACGGSPWSSLQVLEADWVPELLTLPGWPTTRGSKGRLTDSVFVTVVVVVVFFFQWIDLFYTFPPCTVV